MRKPIILKHNDLSNLQNTYLWQYWNDIKSKKIIIGFELKQQLEKLLQDLESEEFFYDTSEADKRIDFIENCLQLTKSPFYGEPFKLLLFQKAFIESLYSFKMTETKLNRFQKAMFLISRKNGKSELCSALLLTDMLIGGKGRDIVCSSNDDGQADILFEACNKMREMIDPKNIDTWKNQKGLKCLMNDNKIFKLSQRTRNREGRNINLAVCDEIHEMAEADGLIKQIEQSQSLKDDPLLIMITTEGTVNGGFLDNELIRARGILNDEIENRASKRYLIWLYTQDSENEIWQGNKENRLWEKSNPTLGKIKKYDYLEQQVDLAKGSKTDRVFVLSKDFNVKQSNSEAWLKNEDYEYEEIYNLDDFRNSIVLGAVDIAETTDLSSAKVLLMKPNDTKKYIHSMYFIPEGKLLRYDDKSAGAKYEEWANKGLIKICEGNYIDTSILADWFFSLYENYGLRFYKTGYDAKFANEFINKMDSYGFETESVWQRPEIMSQPINMVEADLKDRKIIGLNEIDKWCLSNASLKVDSRGFGLLEKIKGQNSRKIDGAVSLCILYETFRRYRNSFTDNL